MVTCFLGFSTKFCFYYLINTTPQPHNVIVYKKTIVKILRVEI